MLFNEGLVHRIPYLALDQVCGGATYAYGLSDKGARKFGGKSFDEHSERTLDHEIAITDFHIGLRRLCDLHQLELYWLQKDLKRGIHPDAYFAITDPSKAGKNTNHFFLEVERQRMGGMWEGRPSILRKLDRYYDLYNTGGCEKAWGCRTFRVVIVVKTPRRMHNLLQTLTGNLYHGMFLLSCAPGVYQTPKDSHVRSYSMLDMFERSPFEGATAPLHFDPLPQA